MKTKNNIILLTASFFSLVVGGCASPYYADQGALFGGLAGLGIGTAIGEHNGNPLAGAAIGTAVGTITGAAVGQSIDADIARSQAEIEARVGRRMAGAVTTADVVAMSQAGLGDEVIVTHIRANGVAQRLQASHLIDLKNQGVSEAVINCLQQTPSPRLSSLPQRRPVIVEEHYYGWPHGHYGYHYGNGYPGARWGYSYSH